MGNAKHTDLDYCPSGNDNCTIGETLTELRNEIDSLRQLVNVDALTGLFNIRHLNFSLEQEMERSRRSLSPTTFLIIDADYFKRINDQHGHVVGDHALKHLAQIIRGEIRRIDVPCRYGGEEFAVILPSTPCFVGVQVAERIRRKVEETPLVYGNKVIAMTLSAGVATFVHQRDMNLEDFIAEADQQLYHAKSAGRNRIHYIPETLDNKAEVTQSEKDALFHQFTESPHPEPQPFVAQFSEPQVSDDNY